MTRGSAFGAFTEKDFACHLYLDCSLSLYPFSGGFYSKSALFRMNSHFFGVKWERSNSEKRGGKEKPRISYQEN
jgi:hypothetical protein